jgi:hypothetical protein
MINSYCPIVEFEFLLFIICLYYIILYILFFELKIFNSKEPDGNKISHIIDSTLKKAAHKKYNLHDEMFTMYYFFKGITSGPEQEQFAAKPSESVLLSIYHHLEEIEKILRSYNSSTSTEQATMIKKYRDILIAILTNVKKSEITVESFKLKPEAGEIDEYTSLVRQFIRQSKSLNEFVLDDNLKEFTDIVKARLAVLGETTENIEKFITEIEKRVPILLAALKEKKAQKKKGGKRNKTRKHRHQHLKRRITRIMRMSRRRSRGLRKRTNMRGRRQ